MPTKDGTASTTRTDQIALVTGANKGIGFEIARQLASRGMTVYVGARDRGRGIAVAEKLEGEGLAARFIELDVFREDTIRAAAAAIEAAHGRLDVLVNNAGGAAEAIRLALLPADGPTGEFFSSAGPVPW
jgi:NAD(P)-dependent dehydrogenase (short-subunit alcohol dehydrogenase family)